MSGPDCEPFSSTNFVQAGHWHGLGWKASFCETEIIPAVGFSLIFSRQIRMNSFVISSLVRQSWKSNLPP